jgi:hypothetical protein
MIKLLQLLTPTRVVASVKEIDPAELKSVGIDAIITDLDNTLVPWRHYEISPGVIEWLAQLKVAGIKICIASNTIHTSRLRKLAETLDIPFVEGVQKPRRGGFLRAMRLMGSKAANTAVMGDQLFTDVLAGNRLHLMTILLRPPLSKEEFISTQVLRYVENGVIRRLRRTGLWPVADKMEKALQSLPDPAAPEVRRVSNGVLLGILASVVIAVYLYRRGRGIGR